MVSAEKTLAENGICEEEDGVVHRDVKPKIVFQDSQTRRFRDDVGGEERNGGEVGGDERNGEEREEPNGEKVGED
ncbi:hypothetical protein ACOSQ4_015840 [Xanthoceras sorbifolium]